MNQITLEELIKKISYSEISSISRNISEISSILNDPGASAKKLKDVIDHDPPLTAKVLKAANSAYYGPRHRIGEIQHAIVWLGFDVVRELALSQKVCELFSHTNSQGKYSRNKLWKHSVAVGLCGKLIYRREFREKGNDIYAAGLMHDIGLIILDQFLHDDFTILLQKMENTGQNLIELENNYFLFNHADIGRELAWNWGLPMHIAAAIGAHHYPVAVLPEYNRVARVLYLADVVCGQMGLGFGDCPLVDHPMYLETLTELDIKPKAIELIMEKILEEMSSLESAGWFA